MKAKLRRWRIGYWIFNVAAIINVMLCLKPVFLTQPWHWYAVIGCFLVSSIGAFVCSSVIEDAKEDIEAELLSRVIWECLKQSSLK